MSETKWTREQWDAITERDCNLLVAAAAGAGKTAVLVERIIKKITDTERPVDIDRLLIVTFTNAAATEMRERIGEAITAVLEKNPGSRLIQRQLALLGKASITTIHSFCLEVIRNHFQNIDIDPDFRIADETESSLLKLEALNDLFEEQYEREGNEAFFDLLEGYGGNRDDTALMDMVSSLHDFIQSSPWPEAWLDDMTQALNLPEGVDFAQTPWGRVLTDAVRLELKGLTERLGLCIPILEKACGLSPYLPVYKEDYAALADLEGLAGKSDWDRLYEALDGLEFATLPRLARDADKEKQEQVRKIRDDVKGRVRKLRERMLIAPSEEIAQDLRSLHAPMQCLASLVKELSERYAAKKSRKSLVDFNDLEHFCLRILTERDEQGGMRPSPVALSYRERFAEILVDEYQDSNLVQEMMITMMARSGDQRPNVFMVGDVKQSIYRFRQARPELFLHKYGTYSDEKGHPSRRILLFKNFRSRESVVDAVNFIFKQIMSEHVGELDYTEAEALNPGAVYEEITDPAFMTGGEAELHLIQTGEGREPSSPEENPEEAGQESEEDEEEILDNLQCEARLVGARILELLKPDDSGKSLAVWDKTSKTYRRAEFRDIVILLRTTRRWSEVFAEELALMGIPSFADTGSGFFKTIEVQVMLSLLQIIDNPLQDIPLLSVLRSPIGGFTTDELADLRLADRKAPLYEALKVLSTGAGTVAKKAEAFLDNLHAWREMSRYLSTDQLVWRLYSETGYYGMVGAMPSGGQRQANLRILFERARQFEETSYKGLFHFIRFVDKLKGSKGDMGSAKTLSGNDNVVRIMSIHKSKGLEFPVVFLSGCGKRFNLQDMNKNILLHQDLGFGPDVVDHRRRLSWPSVAKLAIKEKIRGETLSEEMRILYVALTRAREKLIITGAVKDWSKAAVKWSAPATACGGRLPDYDMFKGASYLDWIGPALLRHPDADILRSVLPLGTETVRLAEDRSSWSFRLWGKNEVQSGIKVQEKDERAFLDWLDGLSGMQEQEAFCGQMSLEDLQTAATECQAPDTMFKEIDRRLSWQYPYAKASLIPAKVSVTELKRRFNTQAAEESAFLTPALPPLVKKPLFLEGQRGLTPAEKGTALHFVMQHLHLEAFRADHQNLDLVLSSQMDAMVAKELITRQQADSVEIRKISRFFRSSLGTRMLASGCISREVPFNMEIPCSELYRENRADPSLNESVLLQGVIDCFFEEEERLVLVDYKTDYVPEGRRDMILERYRMQIDLYARALMLLTGKPVSERYIYLFWTDEAISL